MEIEHGFIMDEPVRVNRFRQVWRSVETRTIKDGHSTLETTYQAVVKEIRGGRYSVYLDNVNAHHLNDEPTFFEADQRAEAFEHARVLLNQ